MKTTSASFISRHFRVSKLAYLALLSLPILATAQDPKDTKTTGVLDAPAAGISTKRTFPLRCADAKELADAITSLFATPKEPRGLGGRFGGFGGFGGVPGTGEGRANGAATSQNQPVQPPVSVTAGPDGWSNSLIVNAPEDAMGKIEDIIKQIDVLTNGGSTTHAFRLQHADALEVAATISNIYSDASAQPGAASRAMAAISDPRTNSLIVVASEDTMIKVSETVNELDRTNAQKQRVHVIHLQHADPEELEHILREQLPRPGNVDPELPSQPHQGDPGPPGNVLRRIIGMSPGDLGRGGKALMLVDSSSAAPSDGSAAPACGRKAVALVASSFAAPSDGIAKTEDGTPPAVSSPSGERNDYCAA